VISSVAIAHTRLDKRITNLGSGQILFFQNPARRTMPQSDACSLPTPGHDVAHSDTSQGFRDMSW
jgi:hypothetical protein